MPQSEQTIIVTSPRVATPIPVDIKRIIRGFCDPVTLLALIWTNREWQDLLTRDMIENGGRNNNERAAFRCQRNRSAMVWHYSIVRAFIIINRIDRATLRAHPLPTQCWIEGNYKKVIAYIDAQTNFNPFIFSQAQLLKYVFLRDGLMPP